MKNGIQSIPRSRSQARTAARGSGRPRTFSYEATVTHSTSTFMRTMMPYGPRGRYGPYD